MQFTSPSSHYAPPQQQSLLTNTMARTTLVFLSAPLLPETSLAWAAQGNPEKKAPTTSHTHQKLLPSKRGSANRPKLPHPRKKNHSKSKSTIASNPTHPPTTLLKQTNTKPRQDYRKEKKRNSKASSKSLSSWCYYSLRNALPNPEITHTQKSILQKK
jgi:hypothetical protein